MESIRMRLVLLLALALFLLSYAHGHVDAQELTSAWLDDMGIDVGVHYSSAGEMCDGRLGECEENENDVQGRLLRRIRYYISYGALSANRVPCPPRSGRSYYTRNCHRASGPVRPYRRGCTAITRCARYTS